MLTHHSPLPETLGTAGVRVRTLVAIRWMAIGGQFATVAFVSIVLGFDLPLVAVGAAMLASVILNVGLLTLYPRTARLVGVEAFLHLAFDLAQLGALLYLTGGLVNPFSILLVVPVTISATLLSARATILLIGCASLIAVALWQWSLPLPWNGPPPTPPATYRLAMLIALGVTLVFLSTYILRLSLDARRWQRALVVTEAVLDREVKMSALGALAAASAHELGGPLGTISLIAKELSDALAGDPDFGEDIALLDREAKRCREIMTGLAVRAEVDSPFPHVSLDVLLHEAAQAFTATNIEIAAPQSTPQVTRTPELLHGLVNIIDNAARHAQSKVSIRAEASAATIRITIEDDGPGFPPDLLPQLGDPYLGPSRSARGGTGLGIFIATTLLERTGGKLQFRNRTSGGAQVEISWRRDDIVSIEDARI